MLISNRLMEISDDKSISDWYTVGKSFHS